jgi:TolB-like protein
MKINGLGAIVLLLMACLAAGARQPPQQVDVLLLPWSAVNQADAWIGEAVQQNLLNELGRTRLINPLTPAVPPAQPVTDIAAAREMAGNTTASHVVFGSYHVSEEGLRLTGQVVEVSSGRVVGSARATGPMRDLFGLEDAVAEQVRGVLLGVLPRPEPQAQMVPVVPETVARIAGGLQPGARIEGPLIDHRPPPRPLDWDLRPNIVGDVHVSSYTYYYSSYAPRYFLVSPPVFSCVPTRRFHSSTGFGFSGAYHGSRGHIRFGGGAMQGARQ